MPEAVVAPTTKGNMCSPMQSSGVLTSEILSEPCKSQVKQEEISVRQPSRNPRDWLAVAIQSRENLIGDAANHVRYWQSPDIRVCKSMYRLALQTSAFDPKRTSAGVTTDPFPVYLFKPARCSVLGGNDPKRH
jgi:hypothetical protein